VRFDGAPVNGPNRNVGYMTQTDTVLPWRTAVDNIAYPLELRNAPAAERRRIALDWIGRVGLEGFERHYPRELSGGMRKRVLLARTLVYGADTILLDEPFGALDAQMRVVLQAELMRLWYADGTVRKTIVLVTHDLTEAIALADRVVIFSARPGRIKVIERISIPHPRDIVQIRFNAGFGDYYERLWSQLGPEVGREVA
jgi:NitT/TauT family transport system ATP-binding protein